MVVDKERRRGRLGGRQTDHKKLAVAVVEAAGVGCGRIYPEAVVEAGSIAVEGECRMGSANASRQGRNYREEAWNAMDTP